MFFLKMKSDWICNSFNRTTPDFSHKDIQQYNELMCNRDLKVEFSSDNLIKFWVKAQCKFLHITIQALLKILPFATTYLCKTEFSSCISTETNWMHSLKCTFSYQVSQLTLCIFAQAIRLIHHIQFGMKDHFNFFFFFTYLLSPWSVI